MVFILRQLQERRQGQNKGRYATFGDLAKAFQSRSRTCLWLVLKQLGCTSIFLLIVIQLHKDRHRHIRLNGDLSEPFPITNGVMQGCVLALTLFSMMLKQQMMKMGCM